MVGISQETEHREVSVVRGVFACICGGFTDRMLEYPFKLPSQTTTYSASYIHHMSDLKFNPDRDIPDLGGKVIFITGGRQRQYFSDLYPKSFHFLPT